MVLIASIDSLPSLTFFDTTLTTLNTFSAALATFCTAAEISSTVAVVCYGRRNFFCQLYPVLKAFADSSKAHFDSLTVVNSLPNLTFMSLFRPMKLAMMFFNLRTS